jgi:hypothetical protein
MSGDWGWYYKLLRSSSKKEHLGFLPHSHPQRHKVPPPPHKMADMPSVLFRTTSSPPSVLLTLSWPHPTLLVSSGHLKAPTQPTTSHIPNFAPHTACPGHLSNPITFLCLLIHFFLLPVPHPSTFWSPHNYIPPLPGWLPIIPNSFTAHSITVLFGGPMKTCY